MKKSDFLWIALPEAGLEHLHLQTRDGVVANGLVVRSYKDQPVRLQYTLHCDAAFRFQEVRLHMLHPTETTLQLQRDASNTWRDGHGQVLPALAGCIDIDIQMTPFTNTLPIRRLQLKPGASADIRVAYVSVPTLSVVPLAQRYTCLEKTAEGAVYLYENIDSDYEAELEVDADGMVLVYPDQFERVG